VLPAPEGDGWRGGVGSRGGGGRPVLLSREPARWLGVREEDARRSYSSSCPPGPAPLTGARRRLRRGRGAAPALEKKGERRKKGRGQGSRLDLGLAPSLEHFN